MKHTELESQVASKYSTGVRVSVAWSTKDSRGLQISVQESQGVCNIEYNRGGGVCILEYRRVSNIEYRRVGAYCRFRGSAT